MVGTETGIPQHAERDHRQRREQHLAGSADGRSQQHHQRQRNREVIGVALLEAERTRRQFHHQLEEPGAQNGQEPQDRHRARGELNRLVPLHMVEGCGKVVHGIAR